MSDETEKKVNPIARFYANQFFTGWTGASLAWLVMRYWIGVRLLLAGLDKFMKVKSADQVLAEATEAGVELGEGDVVRKAEFSTEYMTEKMGAIANSVTDYSFLAPSGQVAEIISKSMLLMPWLMLGSGIMVLTGFFTNLGLFIGGLIFTVLSIGLMTLPDSEGIAHLGIHVALTAGCLALTRHSKFRFTPL